MQYALGQNANILVRRVEFLVSGPGTVGRARERKMGKTRVKLHHHGYVRIRPFIYDHSRVCVWIVLVSVGGCMVGLYLSRH